MRETKKFNCAGATLLGMNLLDKGGIKSYCGNPHGHVVNIVKLSNGEWWYVDFRNGKKNFLKLEAEEIEIVGTQILKINQPEINYKLIPVYNNTEAAGFVLGNLSSLKHEVEHSGKPDKNSNEKQAKELIKKHEQIFQKTDFYLLHEILYPKFVELEKINEI